MLNSCRCFFGKTIWLGDGGNRQISTTKRNQFPTIGRQCIECTHAQCWVNMRCQVRSTKGGKHMQKERGDSNKKNKWCYPIWSIKLWKSSKIHPWGRTYENTLLLLLLLLLLLFLLLLFIMFEINVPFINWNLAIKFCYRFLISNHVVLLF